MKALLIAVALLLGSPAAVPSSFAADLTYRVIRDAQTVVRPKPQRAKVRIRVRPVVYRSRRAVGWRTIGMPCVLPPHVIVQRNWNGPQCRYVDNIIPGDVRVIRTVRLD